jgi:hypothetical protein
VSANVLGTGLGSPLSDKFHVSTWAWLGVLSLTQECGKVIGEQELLASMCTNSCTVRTVTYLY